MTLVTFLVGGLGLLSMTYFAQTRPTTMQTPFSGRLETLGMLATSGGVLKRVKDGEDPNNGVSRLAWQQFESKANEEVRLVGGWDEEQLWDSVANQSVPIPRGSNELHIQACGLENSWPWYFEERVGLTKPSAYYFETGFDSRGLPLRPSKLKGLFDRVARRFQKNMLSLTMTRYKQVGPKFVIVYSIESESRFDAKQLNESMDRFLEIRQLVKESIDTQDDERE